MFKRIHFDTVPAVDVERARDFYRDKLGFAVARDNPYGGSRWVFMRIPGADTLLHFDKRDRVEPTATPALVLVADDVDRTCETLRQRGIPIKQGPQDAPWEPGTRWAMIDDSEGNLVLIQTVPEDEMADLRNNFVGIKSPNPFWLASAPPTDKEYNVERAFKAGWGGVVWKTLGEAGPPVVNVNGPRYGAIWAGDRRLMGFNNIELITDRDLQKNLQEIKAVKMRWPDRAVIVSIMVPCDEDSWKAILPVVEETGADGIELNFGCPHGMSERGMGAAVGQVPEYVEMVVRWCKQYSRMPVITKLTPNVTDIRRPARAAKSGGTDAVSLINTINSITSVDLDLMAPMPTIDGKGTHGGYCGPAAKPIALHMVAEIARDPLTLGLPISGIGGITTWRDAAEFLALGAGNVQVCTAAMVYGFKIVEEMVSGLSNWMDEKGYRTLDDFTGKASRNVTDWQYLNLDYITKAKIDQELCIKCGRCHIACEDTSHQAIMKEKDGVRHFEVMDDECVGCNLCVNVCPVEDCISMVQLAPGSVDERTGRVVTGKYANWTTHPNNPMRKDAVEPAE